MSQTELDIEGATQSVELSRRWEELLANLRRPSGDWAQADALAQAIDGLVGPRAEAPGAEPWRVAAGFLRAMAADRELRELAHQKGRDVTAVRSRLSVLLHEVKEAVANITNALRDQLLSAFDAEAVHINLGSALQALSGLTLPTLYFRGNNGSAFSRNRRTTQNSENTPQAPVLRVIASIDGTHLTGTAIVRTGVLHALRFQIKGAVWPADAARLRLGLLSTCPPACYSISLTEIPRPGIEGEFSAEVTGHISFLAAQSSDTTDLVFVVQVNFDLPEGRVLESPVVGHHQLRLRIVDQRTQSMNHSDGPAALPTLGIITALTHETAAVRAVFGDPQRVDVPGAGAGRAYWLAEIPSPLGGVHRVAMAQADKGNNVAAIRASLMLTHFPGTSVIMCGIAGGVPSPGKPDDHVRLGDIVVSNEKGVVQYDFVKRTVRKKRTDVAEEIRSSPRPPSALLAEAVRILESNGLLGQRPWERFLQEGLTRLEWRRPDESTDILLDAQDGTTVLQHPTQDVRRPGQPLVLLGPIASANTLLKDPMKRDALREQFGVKAVEMEASGIADATWTHGVGYLVVRAICDYCDMKKNDVWQKYAAVAAAAYVRALLEAMPGITTSSGR
jgi:nucleoside phosphorylase